MHTCAVVGVDGAIDWCCLPRFDSPSVFAALLDDNKGGRFQIAPEQAWVSSQAYLPRSNVLKTTFKADSGEVELIDFMPCFGDLRSRDWSSELHRIARCTKGSATLRLTFDPRFDYARQTPELIQAGAELTALSSAGKIKLGCDRELHRESNTTFLVGLEEGESATFVMTYGPLEAPTPDPGSSASKLQQTLLTWETVASRCNYGVLWSEQVLRSFLTLHLLLYAPTGAVLAAATTSLPEEIGGVRNWDYRFCWLRDAAFTFDILFRLGHTDEATGFLEWLFSFCPACGCHTRARPLYGIDFASDLTEYELDHLEGYRGSRPVRIGNQAAEQFQLDIFGEVILAAATYQHFGGTISPEWWELVENFAGVIYDNWQRPDRGIWEVRGRRRHFVFSKLMCWVGLDRAFYMARALGRSSQAEGWARVRDQIKAEILERGWNEKKQSFVQSYGAASLDASNLLLPMLGFLPADDPRIAATVERIAEELAVNGLVRRYDTDRGEDGLPGSEGTFTLCSFWLTGDLILLGRVAEARQLFERLLGYANHLGLFSEMIDPITGQALGNFPQAFTHLALITPPVTWTEPSKAGRPTQKLGHFPTLPRDILFHGKTPWRQLQGVPVLSSVVLTGGT